MDNTNYQSAVQEAVKAKFKGRDKLDCAVTPKYPYSAEREYARINRAYSRIMNQELKKFLPEIMDAYEMEMRKDSREDGISDFIGKLDDMFFKMTSEMGKMFEKFGIEKRIEKISKMVQNTAIFEWTRSVKSTLGIDVLEDYYKGEAYRRLLDKWTSDNAIGAKNIPAETVLKIKEIIEDGYRDGRSAREVKKQIQDEYDSSKKKGNALARDQVSTLNALYTKTEQQDAGVKCYRWRSKQDDSVRESHRFFDGNIYYWDNPPEGWYMTKSKGIVYTGRFYHPGEDYCCRCIAEPIFEYNSLNLPMR